MTMSILLFNLLIRIICVYHSMVDKHFYEKRVLGYYLNLYCLSAVSRKSECRFSYWIFYLSTRVDHTVQDGVSDSFRVNAPLRIRSPKQP